MGQTGQKKRAEIQVTILGHLQLHALITCNSGQHFADNVKLFPDCPYTYALQCFPLMAFGSKQMSCDLELGNKWACCSGKNVSYITMLISSR